jgi:hypothetical protein
VANGTALAATKKSQSGFAGSGRVFSFSAAEVRAAVSSGSTLSARVDLFDASNAWSQRFTNTVTYSYYSINTSPVVSGFYVNDTSSGVVSGGFSISDPDGDNLTKLRVHIAKTFNGSECVIDVGPSYTYIQASGNKIFSSANCANIMIYSGYYYAKVEAWDTQGNKAEVVRTSFIRR